MLDLRKMLHAEPTNRDSTPTATETNTDVSPTHLAATQPTTTTIILFLISYIHHGGLFFRLFCLDDLLLYYLLHTRFLRFVSFRYKQK